MEVILMQQMAFLRRSRILFVYSLLLKIIMTGVWSYLCSHAGTARVIWFKWRSDSCICWDNLFFECTHSPQAGKPFISILLNDIQWLLPGLNKGGHTCLFFHFAIFSLLSSVSCCKTWDGDDVVTRDYWFMLVWLSSCFVGIGCLCKAKNGDKMAGWMARLLTEFPKKWALNS